MATQRVYVYFSNTVLELPDVLGVIECDTHQFKPDEAGRSSIGFSGQGKVYVDGLKHQCGLNIVAVGSKDWSDEEKAKRMLRSNATRIDNPAPAKTSTPTHTTVITPAQAKAKEIVAESNERVDSDGKLKEPVTLSERVTALEGGISRILGLLEPKSADTVKVPFATKGTVTLTTRLDGKKVSGLKFPSMKKALESFDTHDLASPDGRVNIGTFKYWGGSHQYHKLVEKGIIVEE